MLLVLTQYVQTNRATILTDVMYSAIPLLLAFVSLIKHASVHILWTKNSRKESFQSSKVFLEESYYVPYYWLGLTAYAVNRIYNKILEIPKFVIDAIN